MYRKHIPAVVSILLLGGYYVHNLAGGLWEDEVIYMKSGVSLLTGYPFVNPTHMHAPIGKYVLGIAQFLGPDVVAARGASVVLGLASMVVVYIGIVKVVDDPRRGPIGATIAIIAIGTTPEFVYRIPMALLASTIAFTVSLLTVTTALALRTERRMWTIVAGVAATLVGASKLQGGLWALSALAFFVYFHRKRDIDIKWFLLGVIGSLPLVYIVYLPETAPDYFSGMSPPAIVTTFGDIPFIGAVGYTYGAAIVTNLIHMSSNPTGLPVWIYLVWLVTGIGIPVVVAFVFIPIGWIKWRDSLLAFLLGVSPLVVMSILPVKAQKNLVPLLIPIGFLFGVAVVHILQPLRFKPRPEKVLSLLFIVMLLIVPPGGVWLSSQPAPDTAHDELYDRFKDEDGLRISYDSLIVFDWYNGDRRYENFTTPYHKEVEFDVPGGTLVMWHPRKASHPNPDFCVIRTESPGNRGEIYRAHVPSSNRNISYVVIKSEERRPCNS